MLDTQAEHQPIEVPFNPEVYLDKIVDIVHRSSLERVVMGSKPADIEAIQDARRILQRIQALEGAGVDMRFIDDQLLFSSPNSDKQIVVGGAFDGECIAAYMQSAVVHGVEPFVDPLLTLKLD